MKPETTARAAAAALLLWAVALHFLFFASAGALWRDEANSVNQANLGSWREVRESLQYDSFPALYPALLRAWTRAVPPASDAGLRLFGLAVGLTFALSMPAAARLAGFRWPVAALLLLAAGPLFVSETASLRPYGIGFVCLVWSFAFYARSLQCLSAGWLAAAALSCTLSVQASYSNAAQVGAMALCAATAALRFNAAGAWKLLVPACAAALSLVPYAPVVRRAADWAALVRQPVDWPAFAARFIHVEFVLFAAPWLVFALLALASRRVRAAEQGRGAVRLFFGTLLAAALPAQLLMLEALGVAPFPRYFLPALVPMALSLDGLAGPSLRRSLLAVGAALLLAVPTWSALRQRRTNADEAGVTVSAAAPRDLVLVSPWFLHPSFQRYYHGAADWTTVPGMPAAPMMRYDLVKRAMLDPGADAKLASRMRGTLSGGGAVWLVTQRRFRSSPGARKPQRPLIVSEPRGGDYVRFRSYWEDGIEYALAACCEGTELPAARGRAVWDEEDLVVVRWSLKH